MFEDYSQKLNLIDVEIYRKLVSALQTEITFSSAQDIFYYFKKTHGIWFCQLSLSFLCALLHYFLLFIFIISFFFYVYCFSLSSFFNRLLRS